MSIFGSLYSAVSGIQSQGVSIGIISDNISNVNTVGYKGGSQYFGTLVTNSGGGTAYSPGGVRAQNRQLITQQGLIQGTSSPLDIAISGNGLFVVTDSPGTDATIQYTRAGSFRTDSLGNFVNPAGLYLKAWRVDSDGKIPSNGASLDSLQIVNIGNASGDASATTRVEVGVNLNASQSVFKGSGDIGRPGSENTSLENAGLKASSIMVPNANLKVGDELTVTTGGTTAYNFVYGGFAKSLDITDADGDPMTTDTILGADNATEAFGTGVSANDYFTITRTSDSSNPIKFTFVAANPNSAEGEFNSLETLAEAMDKVAGLTARVETSAAGEINLYVAADDAREGLTFTAGAGSTANFPTALGLTTYTSSSANRFNTIKGLSNLVNSVTSDNLKARLIDPDTAAASIEIYNADPQTIVQFSTTNNGGGSDFLGELGLSAGIIPPAYDAGANSNTSMASGNITPAFTRGVRVYDSLGQGHDLTMSFIKVANNTWRAELYAASGDDIDSTSRQIAAGEVKFNGDGSLASVDSSLINIPTILWKNEAASQGLVLDFGTAGDIGEGKTDGLRQFAGFYNVDFINQNGAEAGLLDSVSIDKDGFIVANFNNGQTQKLYKIPLADFSNANGLISKNGNSFIQSFASGEVNLKEPGSGGVGTISPSSLEAANTELSEELTDMIVAQRAYQASAKVITTADQLLEELNRVIS